MSAGFGGTASKLMPSKLLKVTQAPVDEDHRSGQHRFEEGLCTPLARKLRRREYLGIDFPADGRLGREGQRDNVSKRGIADHHEIQIASRRFMPGSNGAEHEYNAQVVKKGDKGGCDHICHARCLAKDTGQLRVNRALGVRAVGHLIPTRCSLEQANRCQQVQFPQHGTRGETGSARHLPSMQGVLRTQQQQAKDAPAVLGQ